MPYETVEQLVARIDEPNRTACARIVADHRALFATVPGSTHNHQAWRGGYLDHVTEVMNIAMVLYAQLSALRPLPFSRSDLVASARLWFDHPADENDPWNGAARIAPEK